MRTITIQGDTPGEFLKSMVYGKRELFDLGLNDQDDLWAEDVANLDNDGNLRYGRDDNGEPIATVEFIDPPEGEPTDAEILEALLLASANGMALT